MLDREVTRLKRRVFLADLSMWSQSELTSSLITGPSLKRHDYRSAMGDSHFPRPARCLNLCERFLHHFSVNIGQSIIAALVAEGEAGVVDAKEVQYRCIQVMYVHRVVSDVVGEIIRLADDGPPFHSAAGHPDGETTGVMVPAVIVGGERSL